MQMMTNPVTHITPGILFQLKDDDDDDNGENRS